MHRRSRHDVLSIVAILVVDRGSFGKGCERTQMFPSLQHPNSWLPKVLWIVKLKKEPRQNVRLPDPPVLMCHLPNHGRQCLYDFI